MTNVEIRLMNDDWRKKPDFFLKKMQLAFGHSCLLRCEVVRYVARVVIPSAIA